MIRKARLSDADDILQLINYWAKRGKVLERTLADIYENLRDFWVYERKGKIIGVCGLHVVGWQGLGEIRSLVVDKCYQKKGIGKDLVYACIEEAKSLGIKKIFILTFIGDFFRKMGFQKIKKEKFPSKIWRDCINCKYFPNCKEEAFILRI
jgi:amino-acid N-acetyltransferase